MPHHPGAVAAPDSPAHAAFLAAGLSLILAVSGLGCAPPGGGASKEAAQSNASLTEQQRDSVLAKSALPGAATVGAAMEVADSAAARAGR